MRFQAYAVVSALLFGSVAVAHLIRLLLGWPVTIDGWSIPIWLSVPGFAATASLSIWGFTAAAQARPGMSSPGGLS